MAIALRLVSGNLTQFQTGESLQADSFERLNSSGNLLVGSALGSAELRLGSTAGLTRLMGDLTFNDANAVISGSGAITVISALNANVDISSQGTGDLLLNALGTGSILIETVSGDWEAGIEGEASLDSTLQFQIASDQQVLIQHGTGFATRMIGGALNVELPTVEFIASVTHVATDAHRQNASHLHANSRLDVGTGVAMPFGVAAPYIGSAGPTSAITGGAFTPGVDGVSNPTVVTDSSGTFSAGEIVRLRRTDLAARVIGLNDGYFEVLTHVGTLLTFRGVGNTDTVETFTQIQLFAETGTTYDCRVFPFSVLQANGVTGEWESAQGTATPLAFTPLGGGGGGDLVSWGVSQTAHGLAVRDVVRLTASGDYVKAQSDSGDTLGVFVVVTVDGVDDFTVGIVGRYTDTAHGLTVGDYYYLSSDTAGALTDIEPTSPNFSNPVVLVKDANTLVIVPWRPSDLASGGGGSGSLVTTVWSPDSPPETPNALDDEFNGDTIIGWTKLDNTGLLTGTESSGRLNLIKQTFATREQSGYFRTVPAVSDYSITTKCMMNPEAGGVYLAGLFLAEDLDANPTTANLCQVSMSLGDADLFIIARADYAAGGTPANSQALSLRLTVYMRFRVSGTTVDVDISWDGLAWRQIKSNFSHGLSGGIVNFGVFADNRTGIDETSSFDFVRVVEDSAFGQVLGGFITGGA